MSETDSFIEEVSEEVRRDRLYGMLRKYGWIGIVVVLAIVGGAAYTEWTASRDANAAQEFGDAVVAAVEQDAPLDALKSIDADGSRAGVLDLTAGGEAAKAGKTDEAITHFQAAADNEALPQSLRQLAQIKAVMVAGTDMDPAKRDAELAELAKPGAPYAPLAQEQQVLAMVEAGDTDKAIAEAQRILQEAELTAGLQQRLSQLIVALGGDVQPD